MVGRGFEERENEETGFKNGGVELEEEKLYSERGKTATFLLGVKLGF